MKNRIYLFALMLMFSCMATTSQAVTKMATKEQSEARAMEIKSRVTEIRAMNFSSMSKVERKGIKQELKGMKSELRSSPTVVYISGGALLLIIILIILLL